MAVTDNGLMEYTYEFMSLFMSNLRRPLQHVSLFVYNDIMTHAVNESMPMPCHI
jgi:hypothetical protein